MNAPIALFAYSRLDHLKRTIDALLANPEASQSELIIFSDAAKTPDKRIDVERVRKYILEIQGFKNITIKLRNQNFGLANSIIDGVTQVLSKYESVIVVEDDIVTSPFFLSFMNESLKRFRDDDRVISIHGYFFPVIGKLPEAFFLRGADCWGWATWRHSWELFEQDGQHLLNELKGKNLLKSFNYNDTYGYSGMLEAQINGGNDSWAIRWHASAFLANKLTLYPSRSLVQNIGNDSSGTHSNTNSDFNIILSNKPIDLSDICVEHSISAEKLVERYYRSKISNFKKIINYFINKENRSLFISIANNFLPIFMMNFFRKVFRRRGIIFEGPFKNWNEALSQSTGYDSQKILEKVLKATLKVKNGEAVYERDSVIFNRIQYSWPIVTGLMWTAAKDSGRLSVLDFGGSLGSSYFQNKQFLEELSNFRWSIIEQSHIVEAGKFHIQDHNLRFYESIEKCLKIEKPNVVLLSGVLQYLEDPFEILSTILKVGIDLIILDRTPFLNKDRDDLIKIQITPSHIYSAAYPIRFFNKNNIESVIVSHGYKIEAEFESLDRLDTSATWKGMFIKRVNEL